MRVKQPESPQIPASLLDVGLLQAGFVPFVIPLGSPAQVPGIEAQPLEIPGAHIQFEGAGFIFFRAFAVSRETVGNGHGPLRQADAGPPLQDRWVAVIRLRSGPACR